MIYPKFPKNEEERLAELKKYNLLDTLSENDFDNITKLIAAICELPISLITLLDAERNFFKSHIGINFNQSPRSVSFCAHAILQDDEIFIIEDATKDERFKDNPLVTENKAVFYAGVPLINPNGFKLGTLCVFDYKPRKLSDVQIISLKSLAKQVVNLFELRKKNSLLTAFQKELQSRNERLNNFAHLVSHDLKSPLANITSLTRLLREENVENLSEDSEMYLNYIEESSFTLKNYINGILKFYKADELLEAQKEDVELKHVFEEIKEILITDDVVFEFPKEGILKNVNKAALSQIFLNLIDNSLKYNLNEKRMVIVNYFEETNFHKFSIKDNGIGIDLNVQDEIFNLFKTSGTKDRNGKAGTGIGLATVKSLVSKLEGTISLQSEPNKGSTFTFTVQK
ncbi:sensor histidine kinase [Aequorivita lipolytica]|uniref:histidine kinase n=1 Tax=Aequorivita lipolytica TaxID=153267 RepID=A0A5C6YK85_9FLAO|nr:GAF domain-containing sensor histidine kinase [Aequorivita lipolytica]TXD67882.1 GAF domain-containing sensor histidine kinase [Aequorivita lipolytica]SRX53834.1 Phytochrome-like protein cph1 [Aequorivita lipolytica]